MVYSNAGSEQEAARGSGFKALVLCTVVGIVLALVAAGLLYIVWWQAKGKADNSASGPAAAMSGAPAAGSPARA